MKITKQAWVKLLPIAVLAAMSAAAVPEREQRNYLDTTWWDPYVENITDVDTYLRRKFLQDVTDKTTGFGAGAHLAAISAVSSQDALYDRIDGLDDISPHLNFAVPVYPAYVLADGATGPNANGGDNAAILPEFKFDAKTPPMFMVHGDRDHYSAMGSVALYAELHKLKIPAQLFIYAHGGHGIGGGVNRDGWQDRIVDWIASIGF